MHSIRSKLLVSFFAIIAVLLALGVFFMFMHFRLISEYQNIVGNMIAEYRVSEASTGLVNTFLALAKSVNDKTIQMQYDGFHDEITQTFAHLDTTIANPASQVSYLGLKNTVTALMNRLDGGIAAVRRGDISGVSATYDSALHTNYFVAENTGTLILNDLHYTEQLEAGIAKNELESEIFGALLLLFVAVGTIFHSLVFSRKLVAPLDDLTTLAGDITKGNFELTVDEKLIAEKDEVGSLAKAFDVMIRSLGSTIRELDVEKKGVEEKVRQRTRELREEHTRFLASILSLSIGFALFDRNHRLILKNDSVNVALGLGAGVLMMDTISDALKDELDVKALGEECMDSRKTATQKLKLKNKFLGLLFGPIIMKSDATDEVIGYVLLIEDETESKLLERTRDEFFMIASHELRTPLTAIKGNAELIRESFASEIKNKEVLSMISDIEEASARLISIANDFLDLSRIEQHRLTMKKEAVDLHVIAEGTLRNLESIASQKKIALRLEAPTTIRNASGDRERVKQIVVNLVGNAINYTDTGSITVTIKEAPSENTVKLSVTDTGIGISPENQNLLFRKFQQANAVMYTRTTTKGTGLGLYISRLLAEDMGGEVRLEESVPGKGSTFSLTLPVAGV